MNKSFDYFHGKKNLTEDDIEDFEAYASIMQDRIMRDIDAECNPKHNKSPEPTKTVDSLS